MYYEEESGVTNFMAGLIAGVVLGAGIALLTAPQTGRTMRARILHRGSPDSELDGYDPDELDDDGNDGGDEDDAYEGYIDAAMEREKIMRDLKRRRRKARR